MSRTPPRIAYLCSDPGIPPDGTKGASVHFREMAKALAAEGADLDVFMARKGSWPDRPVQVVAPPRGDDVDRQAALIANNDAMVAAVAASGPHAAVYERFASFGVAGARYAAQAGIPLILEVNSPLWIEDARYRQLATQDVARDMAMQSIGAADHVVVVSEELKRILVGEGIDPAAIVVMRNGVNRELFEAAQPFERPAVFGDRTVLTFIGSLKPWHGIDFLVGAFERCLQSGMDLGLWIIGDGTLREMVQDAAARRPEHIYWQGAVDHHDIPRILLAADIAVAPYQADAPSYFCPLKAIEALAIGCPLVASDATCVTDVVGGLAGVQLFRCGDEASFQSAVADVVQAHPPGSRQWLGEVPFEYTWASNARRVLEMVPMLLLLIPLLLFAACQSPQASRKRSLADLQPGMRVEAEGPLGRGTPRAEEIIELPRAGAGEADKMEITAPVESVGKDSVRVLGRDVNIVDKTEFETVDRKSTERYPLQPGDWLRLKLRVKEAERLRARTIRRMEPRGQFKVEGAVSALDLRAGTVDIGPLRLRAPQDVKVALQGDGEARRGDDPLSVFMEDDQKSVPFTIRITDDLLVGGQATVDYDVDDEFDLDRARRRDRSSFEVGGKLDLLWIYDNRGSFALLEGRYTRKDRFRTGRQDTTTEERSLSRAYVYFRHSDALRVQVGRQDFDDEREWLYDEVLDGLRLHSAVGPLDFEISASAGREFAEEEGNPTEDTEMYAALARYRVDDDHRLTAYVIQRRDSSPTALEPLLVGLRSYARPSRGLGHWLELAQASGDVGTNSISGTAFDLGVMYRTGLALRPTVYLGYAYGSGKLPGTGQEGFRQTGYQDNNAKFGGVTSFRYYGEILEPELSNIDVSTVGFGFRPLPSLSIDVVAHGYRQDYKSTVLLSDNLRTNPNGRSASIGWEVDFILGYRYENRMRLEMVLGRFEPGAAFDDQDPAQHFSVQARFKF